MTDAPRIRVPAPGETDEVEDPYESGPERPSEQYLQGLVDEEFAHPRRNPGLREFVDRWLLTLGAEAVDWSVLGR